MLLHNPQWNSFTQSEIFCLLLRQTSLVDELINKSEKQTVQSQQTAIPWKKLQFRRTKIRYLEQLLICSLYCITKILHIILLLKYVLRENSAKYVF